MIQVSDLPGWFVSEESAARCRRMLVMMEHMVLPERAAENRQEANATITSDPRCGAPCQHENELWIVSEAHNEETEADSVVSIAGTVMRARSSSPHMAIRAQSGALGRENASGGVMGGVRPVWEEFPSVPRSAMSWPRGHDGQV